MSEFEADPEDFVSSASSDGDDGSAFSASGSDGSGSDFGSGDDSDEGELLDFMSLTKASFHLYPTR